MRWNPHPYQIEAAHHLIRHPQSMLFLRMGFGKTAITLTAIDWLLKHQKITGALILGPVRVIYNSWPDEIEKRLDSCKALILIMTPRSKKSEWVQNELNRAKRKKKNIFPLLLGHSFLQ